MSTVEQDRTGRAGPSRSEADAAKALARQVGLEYVDLDRYPVNGTATGLLPESVARRYHALAIGWKYGTPVVAVATPDNFLAMDDVRTAVGQDLHAVVVAQSQIDAFIEHAYVKESANAVSGSGNGSKEPAAEPAASAVVAAPAQSEPSGDKPASPDADSAVNTGDVEPTGDLGQAADGGAAGRSGGRLDTAAQAVGDAQQAVGDAERVANDTVDDALRAVAEAAADAAELPADPLEVMAEALAHKQGVETRELPEAPKPAPKAALAEVLVASGLVSREEMAAALRESGATGRSLGVILKELGLVSEEDLIRWMADEAGLEFVDLNDFPIDSRAINLLPETMARRHQLLAIGFRGDHPIVAMANPSNVFALDDLRTVLGGDVETVVSSPRQIIDYISRMYRHDTEADNAARSAVANQSAAELSATTLELTDLHAVVEDAPIVKYVNLILRQALQERASDVHVEPAADDLRVRFRIDGVLHDITRSPKSIQGGVTTRLKVMANLDIAEHRIPQDGRISLTAGKREIDLRVATLPTVHGEKVVLRILDKTNAMMDLSDLGFLPEVNRRYQVAYRKPYGTILITGPTGSGKSTTLYSTLNALNSPERNLITVEDPVEYQLPGVNQVQVNPKAGLTFARALRSILRADPDIILVGEMRDRETAIMGVEAAMTGHLVLSSLHTNDAAGTPMRLVEMGVEAFLVASALDCIVAQRLARQLCDNCNEPQEPTAEELAIVGWDDSDAPAQGGPRFRRAVGCQACSRTGYRGRIALHELLIVSEEVERAITATASAEEIQRIGVEQGTIPLRHDGLRKAALGLTSLEEVIRVVA